MIYLGLTSASLKILKQSTIFLCLASILSGCMTTVSGKTMLEKRWWRMMEKMTAPPQKVRMLKLSKKVNVEEDAQEADYKRAQQTENVEIVNAEEVQYHHNSVKQTEY